MKRIFTFFYFALLLYASSSASVSPDATTTSGRSSSRTNKWIHPVSASASLLLVSVTTSGMAATEATFAGIPLTLGATINQENVYTTVYFMVSPPEGQNEVSIGTNSETEIFAGAESFLGTDLNQPFGAFKTNRGHSKLASVTVSSAIGSLVFQTIGTKNAFLQTWGSDQNQLHNINGGSMANYASLKVGANAAPMIGNLNISEAWATIGVSIQAAPTALPVTFLSFNGEKQCDEVKLNWATAMEKDNDYFTIEKSTDGINFTELAKIPSAKQSKSTTEYQYSDSKVFGPFIFYRLSQTDIEGKRTNLSIIKVINPSEGVIANIFPNPTNDVLKVNFESDHPENISLQLSNMNGEIILKQQLNLNRGNNLITIPMTEYQNGAYFLMISNEKLYQKAKIIKF